MNPICPICNKEMFEVYFDDGIKYFRCLCNDSLYSEKYYVFIANDYPVRRFDI